VVVGSAALGLALWAAGALLAIYCHTTLLLWPLVAGLGLLALRRREADRRWMAEFALAGLVVLAGAGWWLAISLEQVRGASGNIGWIAPLGLGPILAVETHYGFPARIVDFADFPAYAITLALLAAALWSGWRARLVRLAALLRLAVAVWWGCSWVHPVVTWGTVLWPMGLVALVLGCGLAQMPGWPGVRCGAAAGGAGAQSGAARRIAAHRGLARRTGAGRRPARHGAGGGARGDGGDCAPGLSAAIWRGRLPLCAGGAGFACAVGFMGLRAGARSAAGGGAGARAAGGVSARLCAAPCGL
jgi:hypothetical protein